MSNLTTLPLTECQPFRFRKDRSDITRILLLSITKYVCLSFRKARTVTSSIISQSSLCCGHNFWKSRFWANLSPSLILRVPRTILGRERLLLVISPFGTLQNAFLGLSYAEVGETAAEIRVVTFELSPQSLFLILPQDFRYC